MRTAPTSTSVAGVRQRTAIPEPDFGRACLIALVATGIGFVLNLVAGIVSGIVGLPQFLVSLLNLVIGYVVAAKVYESMLPTTFGRASLVYVFQVLITIVIAVGIVGLIVAVGAVAG